MSVRFLFLFALVFVFAQAVKPRSWVLNETSFNLTGADIHSLDKQHENFVEEVEFTIKHTKDLQVCLQYLTKLPTEFSEESCSHYFELKIGNKTELLLGGDEAAEDPSSVSLKAFNMPWVLGFKLLKGGDTDKDTVSVKASSKVCDAPTVGYIANLDECVIPKEIMPDTNTTGPLNFTGVDDAMIFKLTVGERVGQLKFSNTPTQTFVTPALEFTLRFGGSPMATDMPSTEITRDGPLAGDWYLLVRAKSSINNGFDIGHQICPESTGGKNCEETYMPAEANMTAEIEGADVYDYYEVILTNETTDTAWLNVSIGYVDKDINASTKVTLFIAKGQLPTASENGHFLGGCNQESCVVNSFFYNAGNFTGNQTWYVGVRGPAVGKTEYGIWFTDGCAPDCADFGTCVAETRVCDCIISREGVNCAKETGRGPQFIVLIIIASLVVASAIIGFVAWAYMKNKRKHGGYRAV